MPRSCHICQHPQRQAIDQALAMHEPYRSIAKRFGTSPAVLYRHHQAHAQLPANTVQRGAQSSAAAPDPRTAALLDTAQRMQTRASAIRQQIVEVRSLHDPKLLERLEDLSCVLIEVTDLLAEFLALLAAPSGR